MFEKIVLAGGTGYLGNVLAKYFRDKAKEIVILSRKAGEQGGNCRLVTWDAETPGAWTKELEGADLLVNLCGKNVNCRYTKEAKAEIFSSRLLPTELLGKVVAGLQNPPKLWINSASATIYRHAEDRPQDEETGEIGTGFSVEVCKAWEEGFFKWETPKTKKVALRVGLVLGQSDGVFPRLKSLVFCGLGGHQGTGRQMVSWVHEQDFARCVEWICRYSNDGNIYNVTAPEAISNRELMKILRQAAGIPLGLPSPHWLLALGAKIIGTETELVLKSRWVYPKRLLDAGFSFSFPTAGPAICEIMSTRT
jgi:uncharacterized protein (TIGR01777 family)